MKKFYSKLTLIPLILILFAYQGMGQDVERNLVVLEEFTGTWCVYCPGASLGIEDLIANDWPVAAVGYHIDDVYETTESVARDSYYGVVGYPTTYFDGILENVGGDPSNSTYDEFWPLVEERMAVLTPITIEMENVSFDGTTFSADVVMEAVGNVTSTNTILYAALTESEIVEQWQSQYYLMEVERLMYNGAEGTEVDLVNNTTETVSIEFELDENWEPANCEVVVFIQDDDTKEVYNGNKEHVLDLEPPTNLSVEAIGSDIHLEWDGAGDALGYNIYRNWEYLDYTEETTYDDLGLEDGTYSYYVRAVYEEFTSGWSNHEIVDVGAFMCEPIYGEGCWSTNSINDIILNEIENLGSGCADLNGIGWSQYLDLGPAVVEAGQTYTFQISTASIYYNEYFAVWVDWNDNLQFEESEMMMQGFLDITGELFDFDFVVPSDASDGLHFMRIRTNYGAEVTDPCGIYSWGEAEDYFINVGEILFVPPTNLTAEVTDSDVHLEWDAPEVELLGYNVYRDGAMIGFTEGTYYDDLELEGGTYSYYVRALYDEGESTPSNSVSVDVGDFLCTPLYIAGCGAGDGFTDFALNEIENYASGCGNLNGNGWSQYLELGPAIVEAGMTYTMTVGAGYNNQYTTVWVDWNDNWEFEPEEIVIDDFVMTGPGTLDDVDFIVPEDAPAGQHFMRARTHYNNSCDDPCAEYQYGEAEDYYIQINGTELCTPAYAIGCSLGDGFTNFTLGQIENLGTGCADLNGPGWSQYLDLGPAELNQGNTHTITMSPGYSSQYTTVWIDFNDDLVLAEDEKVIDNFLMAEADLLYDVDFDVPADANLGEHILRARTKWNEPCDDPCIEYNYGEAEDYIVNITEGGSGNEDCENFDALTAGDLVAEQLGSMWTTWSGTSDDDATVSDMYSSSPENSFVVDANTVDLVFQFGADPLDAGQWLYSNNIYVPTGYSGYFNVQSEPTPGVDWVLDLYFDDGSTGSFGTSSTQTFTYAQDSWILVEINFDLDADYAEVYFDGELITVFSWDGTIGGIDYFGDDTGGVPGAYYDDVCFGEGWIYTGIEEQLLNTTQLYPNPATDQVTIKSEFTIETLTVYNFAGQEILTEIVNNATYRVNTSHFGSGIYLFQIETKEGRIAKRIIIE